MSFTKCFEAIEVMSKARIEQVQREEMETGYTNDGFMLRTEAAERVRSMMDILLALYRLRVLYSEYRLLHTARRQLIDLRDCFARFHGPGYEESFDGAVRIINRHLWSNNPLTAVIEIAWRLITETAGLIKRLIGNSRNIPLKAIMPGMRERFCAIWKVYKVKSREERAALESILKIWMNTPADIINERLENRLITLSRKFPRTVLEITASNEDLALQPAAFTLLLVCTTYPIPVGLRRQITGAEASLPTQEQKRLAAAYKEVSGSIPTDYRKNLDRLWGSVCWGRSGYLTDGKDGFGAAILCMRPEYGYAGEYVLVDPANKGNILPALAQAKEVFPDARYVLGLVEPESTMERPQFLLESLACPRKYKPRTGSHQPQKRFVGSLRYILTFLENQDKKKEGIA